MEKIIELFTNLFEIIRILIFLFLINRLKVIFEYIKQYHENLINNYE